MAGFEPRGEEPVQEFSAELLARLRAGDREAGQALERMYRGPIVRCCAGYLGRQEEAEDAAQEVFVKVLRSDRVPEDFRAWIYKITRNHCLNLIRNRARHPGQELPSETLLHESQTGHLTRLLKIERNDELLRVLASLSDAQRETLRLRYAEGLTRAQIAEVLEIPESVVKSRLFEGLKKLREFTSLESRQ